MTCLYGFICVRSRHGTNELPNQGLKVINFLCARRCLGMEDSSNNLM